MPEYGFGAGALYSTPTGSNQTPTRYGALQTCGVDFKSTTKPLFGQYQLPLTVARGSMNIAGKGEFAQIAARFYNDIFFGAASSAQTGSTIVKDNESGTVPGTSTYIITVTNSATWTYDLGVIYAATGLPLTRVASVSAVGQYSVSAGVYTFYSGDASAAMKISYEYTSTGGETLTISNQLMGVAPNFRTVLGMPYNNQNFTLTLNSCVAESVSMNTSLEDFLKQPFSFMAFADSSGTLGTISFAEVM
jgi:hypothetical protein